MRDAHSSRAVARRARALLLLGIAVAVDLSLSTRESRFTASTVGYCLPTLPQPTVEA